MDGRKLAAMFYCSRCLYANFKYTDNVFVLYFSFYKVSLSLSHLLGLYVDQVPKK